MFNSRYKMEETAEKKFFFGIQLNQGFSTSGQ